MAELPHVVIDVSHYESGLDMAEHFFGHLANTKRIFRRQDGSITYIDPCSGPHRILSIDEFCAVVGSLLNLRRIVGGRHRQDISTTITRAEAVHLFQSSARALLPEIDFVLHEPAVITLGGEPTLIGEEGYHAQARAYYWRRPGSESIKVREGTVALERCLSGVPFFSDAYKNNVYAWLVSAVTLDDIRTPMLAITGNDRGVGKSSLSQACAIIITGQAQSAIQPAGSEFAKQLGAKFSEEQRFIAMDNVTTSGPHQSFKNAQLAALLTEGRSKAVRQLGQSRMITQAGVLFALTANDCRLDQDLATRSLAVNLHRDSPGPMIPYCLQEAKRHRADIYGELLWLALTRKPGSIPSEYRTCRFVDWIDFVVPIVVPRFGPLAIKEAEDLDERIQELLNWAADHLDEPFTSNDLFQSLTGMTDKFYALPQFLISAKGETGRRIRLGLFLRNLIGRKYPISPGVSYQLSESAPKTTNAAATYCFQQV